MATPERIKQLQDCVDGWVQSRKEARERRDKYLLLKALTVQINDLAGADILQQQADAADAAYLQFDQCVTRMQALLGRAQAGEDV